MAFGMEALDRVLPRLQAVRPEGSTGREWLALCPAHNDHSPSLLVTLKDDGKVLLCCRSQRCVALDIVRAIGLTLKDLYPKDDSSPESRIVKAYDYHDAAGTLIYQVVRLREPKDFKQRAADGSWRVKGLPRVPYKYPALVNAAEGSTVFVCEGEKDVDNLQPFGVLATTNPGGAGNWKVMKKEAVKRAFAGKHVIILPDNDESGELHAVDVAARLNGIAASVKVLRLPGLGTKGDVSDWIEDGGTKERLLELVGAKAIQPEVKTPSAPSVGRPGDRPMTDLGNSQRLIDLYGEDIRYLAAASTWLVWDDKRFQFDELNRMQELAKDTVKSIYVEASKIEDVDKRKAMAIWARNSESARAISVLPGLASSDRSVATRVEDWDADLEVMNCANGTVDLRSGILTPHNRKNLLSKLCPVDYDDRARCPLWERILNLIFPMDAEDPTKGGNKPLIDYVQRVFGLAATGLTRAVLPIFHGDGSNGKSTILTTLIDVLGKDYAMQSAQHFLMSKNTESHPTDLADLCGRRMVVVSETDKGRKLDAALVKTLTGGESIRARRMRQDFFEFKPTHTLILCTNHRPRIADTDDGIWRRVSLVPFAVKFWDPDKVPTGPDHLKQDKELAVKLGAEYPGILAWVVRGAMAFLKHGLGEPPDVRIQTEDYRSGENVVGRFFEDKVAVGQKHDRVPLKELYKAYVEWCDQNGERYMTMRNFAGEVRVLGYETTRAGRDGSTTVNGARLIFGSAKTIDDVVDY
jgi:putative DNA primase/helicase